MNHQGTKTISTDRLLLRPFEAADAAPMYANWASDPEVTRFLTWPVHEDPAVTASVIDDWIRQYSRPDWYQWAIVPKEIHEPVGSISIVCCFEDLAVCEVGYCIGRAFWHRGITSEALSAVMGFLFEEVKAACVRARHDTRNPRSGAVMRRCGMHFDGTLRHAGACNAGISDLCCYSLLADEWPLSGPSSASLRVSTSLGQNTFLPSDENPTASEDTVSRERIPDTASAIGSGSESISEAAPSYQQVNAETIDRWVAEGWEWGIPISHEGYERAVRGDWEMVLTPNRPVPKNWFGELRGKRVLGLAAGGGQQMPIFAAQGAACTVLDYSPRQLESERVVAERERYGIEIIRADMTKPLPFVDGSFDLIFHPVSNCYIKDVRPVWQECFRVLSPGGILLSGTDHYINYLVDESETRIINYLPFDPLSDPEQMKQLADTDSGIQFSHTLEEQITGQLRAGFVLTDLYEDTNSEGRLHDLNIPCFLAMRAVKPG